MITTTDLRPLEEQCEWRRDELGDRYVFRLTDAHVDELDAALVEAESRRDDVLDITRDDFPLPTLGPVLQQLARELIGGRGVVLIRGVPVERYAKTRASTIYWGVGTWLGRPWPQNAKGTFWATSPTRAGHRATRRLGATSWAVSPCRSTPTAPISSACSASPPAPTVATASSPTP